MPDNNLRGGISVNLGAGAQAASTEIPNDDRRKIKTLSDLAISNINLGDFPAVEKWRQELFGPKGKPKICGELPGLLTDYMIKSEGENLSHTTRRAEALHHVFTNKKAIVAADALLPGQSTTSFVGPIVHVDTIGLCIWPELKTVSKRPQNPFDIDTAVAEKLSKDVFPYWLERKTVLESARYSAYDTSKYKNENRDKVYGDSTDPVLKKKAGETPRCQEIFERVAFFLSDKATCVSHTVPDFERLLKYGTNGLIEQMEKDINSDLRAVSPEEKEFLEGVIKVFKGANVYSEHLVAAAEKSGNNTLAAICRKVPSAPPETLHEALTSIWICYHLLLQENTNFGFSIGRLDQLLNSYYISDWEKLETEDEKAAYTKFALELVCNFFLRCSDHVPLSPEAAETLFAGSGSNQALTVGGTVMKDNVVTDAVNDMTYIIIKATEMLAIRDPNVHARYHKDIHHLDAAGEKLPDGATSPYLKRLCQANIITRATPAIHGDVPVVKSMSAYYAAHDGISEKEAVKDAHDYASIGCIEQNSAGRHYGNTGSSLVVLPAVLELTIYGGKHRSDGVKDNSPNLFYGTKKYTSMPLIKMKSMKEFMEAFSFQLDEMARHVVQNNNYLGRAMEKVRPVPFLSGLFTGPTNTPGADNASFRDLAAGGAKYNSSGVAIIGLADVIDSLTVIDSLVFGGKISKEELLSAMKLDFVGGDASDDDNDNGFWDSLGDSFWGMFSNDRETTAAVIHRRRMKEIVRGISKAPKYGAGAGADNSLAVKYTNDLTKIIQDTFFKYRSHRGGRYLTGYWSMTNHAGFGMLSKSTPNGRKKGASFASGITPCANIRMRNGDPIGILDHIDGVTSVDPDTVQNGYTYNLSLTPRGSASIADDTVRMANYMKAFNDKDGVLVQMCVASIEEFKEAHRVACKAEAKGAGSAARKALEPYRDLMIRVAGYSAYFVTLSKDMRQEIIDRSNFSIENGSEGHH